MKTLIVYYSLEGNTKTAADAIAEELDADILRLEPAEDIPKDGFKKFMNGGYLAIKGKGTPLKPYAFDKDAYDRIVIGTPIWASRPAPAIISFLNDNDVADKIAGIFTFSGGGNNDKCIKILKKRIPQVTNCVALADRANTALAGENNERLADFIGKLR